MSTLADRRYREALGRKGGYEASWVFDSEITNKIRDKMPAEPEPSSPVTIFSEVVAPPQLLLLPGAWTTVGKNGRPVKHQDLKMYDEPLSRKRKKKKTKKKTRHPEMEDDIASDLAEAASSSNVVTMLDRVVAKHAKEVSRSLEKKYYVRRNRAKRAAARQNALFAALQIDEEDDGEEGGVNVGTMRFEPVRNFNTLAQKNRRARRHAAAAGLCYSVDDAEEAAALEPPMTTQAESKDGDAAIMSKKAKKASRAPRSKLTKDSSAEDAAHGAMSDKRKADAGSATSPRGDWTESTRKSAKKRPSASRSNCSCS